LLLGLQSTFQLKLGEGRNSGNRMPVTYTIQAIDIATARQRLIAHRGKVKH
jgi:hypothetical protein